MFQDSMSNRSVAILLVLVMLSVMCSVRAWNGWYDDPFDWGMDLSPFSARHHPSQYRHPFFAYGPAVGRWPAYPKPRQYRHRYEGYPEMSIAAQMQEMADRMDRVMSALDPWEDLAASLSTSAYAAPPSSPSSASLAMSIKEEDDKYLVRMHLPGVEKEEVELVMKGDELIVRAEHQETKVAPPLSSSTSPASTGSSEKQPAATTGHDSQCVQKTSDGIEIREDNCVAAAEAEEVAAAASPVEEAKLPRESTTQSSWSMKRHFILPDDVDRTKLAANMENGWLTVTLPKKAAKVVEEHRIPIL